MLFIYFSSKILISTYIYRNDYYSSSSPSILLHVGHAVWPTSRSASRLRPPLLSFGRPASCRCCHPEPRRASPPANQLSLTAWAIAPKGQLPPPAHLRRPPPPLSSPQQCISGHAHLRSRDPVWRKSPLTSLTFFL